MKKSFCDPEEARIDLIMIGKEANKANYWESGEWEILGQEKLLINPSISFSPLNQKHPFQW